MEKMTFPALHVIVRFGSAIPDAVQGQLMLTMENMVAERRP